MSDVQQCNHYNDRLSENVRLRPLRCTLALGHVGRHLCGDTSWDEALGFREQP